MKRSQQMQLALFREWMSAHGGIIGKVSRLHSYNATERADLSQEMLVQIWRSTGTFEDQCKPSTWIYRICLNTALAWKRDSGRRNRHKRENEIHMQMVDDCRKAGTGATEDRIEALYAAMRKLPALDRSVIQLAMDGLSYQEIAEVSGLTESNIGTRLTRARRQLATLIEKE